MTRAIFISILKPLPVIEDKAKKSPLCAFSIVIATDGKTVLSATPVPVEPVKKCICKCH